MRKTFNFLDTHTGLDKVIAELERQHPERSSAWLRKQAQIVLAERNRRSERLRASGLETSQRRHG